jgi:hypothetical protein
MTAHLLASTLVEKRYLAFDPVTAMGLARRRRTKGTVTLSAQTVKRIGRDY